MPKRIIEISLVLFFIFIPPNAYSLNLDAIKVNILEGDYKSAIKEGERLIAKEPHSAELYYLLGISYLKDGNYLRASDIFEIIIGEFKDSKFKEEAKLGLGDTYLLRGDFNKAEELYRELINNPESKFKEQAYCRLSEAGFKKGNGSQENISGIWYSIQVGFFSNANNAKLLTQKLISNGYPAYVEESASSTGKAYGFGYRRPNHGLLAYRVKVGKLNSRPEAEELSRKLAREGYSVRICP